MPTDDLSINALFLRLESMLFYVQVIATEHQSTKGAKSRKEWYQNDLTFK